MSEFLEHDGEVAPGIPAELPASERLLWRGSPEWTRLARSRFHVTKLLAYFGLMLIVYVVAQLRSGSGPGEALAGASGFAVLAAVAIGLVLLFARATAGATIFSLTNRRLIIRCGVALPLTMNLPLSRVDKADMNESGDGYGDIALTPAADSRASYILLWPHVRPWRWSRVQPMLRAIPDVRHVAETLGRALDADAAERAARPVEAAPLPATPLPAPSRTRRFSAYPTVPLTAAVGLVAVTVIATGWVSATDDGSEAALPDDVVASVDLRFEDRSDGSIDVIDAGRQNVIDTLEPGDNGFLRSTLRGLARTRGMNGAGPETAFSLLRTESGQLLLLDPVTGNRVDLWAFGTTNAESFARYLPATNEPTVQGHSPAFETTQYASVSTAGSKEETAK